MIMYRQWMAFNMSLVIDLISLLNCVIELVNDKQTYEELKRDPTPALQIKLNPRTYKQTHTPTVVQGGGGLMEPPLGYFEKFSPLVENL